jgi:SEC-C motif domain protein
MEPDAHCPCDSGQTYGLCCKPLHEGEAAATAEQLMRSRYCAYVLDLDRYLLATWHPSTRPRSLESAASRWLGLQVKHHRENGSQATVEFVARHKIGGRAHRLHEISRFVRENDLWYYLDGEFPAIP